VYSDFRALDPSKYLDNVSPGRAATVVVAAVDSSLQSRAQADFLCDGIDDQVEIQAAIDALPAVGGKVQLLEGTFTITAPINMPPYVCLQGMLLAGYVIGPIIRSTTIINSATDGSDAIRVNVGGAGVVGGEIKDLNLVGNALSGRGIYVEAVHWMRISNLRVVKHGGVGIHLQQIYWGGIEACRIGSNGDRGIYLTGDAHCWVIQCEISNNINYNLEIVESSEFCLISNNWFENSAGSPVQNIQIWNSRWTRVIGNVMCPGVTVNNIGIGGDAGEGSKFSLIADNEIKDALGGVRISSAFGGSAVISRNKFRNIDGYPVYIVANDCQILDNKMGDAAYTVGGTNINGVRNTFSNNQIYNNTGTALIFAAGADYGIIENNTFDLGTEYGIYLNGASHCIIKNNIVRRQRYHGIILSGASNCVLIGNISEDNAQTAAYGDGIVLQNTSTRNVVVGNQLNDTQGAPTQKYGYNEATSADDYNIVTENQATRNVTAQINVRGLNTRAYDKYSDLFMDVLAVSANHVVAAQALHLADPTVCVIAAQPDVPRTLSWAFTHPTLTAYTMDIVGVNAKGQTVTETFTQADGWTGETDNAFATVTSITVHTMTGAALGDILNVGITDVLGLSNVIYATGDVYKIKKNNANAVVAGAQVDTDYDTYDMAVIGLVAGDDFTVYFRSNLNIIS